jgi:hypothetical protein
MLERFFTFVQREAFSRALSGSPERLALRAKTKNEGRRRSRPSGEHATRQPPGDPRSQWTRVEPGTVTARPAPRSLASIE